MSTGRCVFVATSDKKHVAIDVSELEDFADSDVAWRADRLEWVTALTANTVLEMIPGSFVLEEF